MKRFLLKSALFLAPVAAYMLLLVLADPYQLFRTPVPEGLTFRKGLKDTVAAWSDNALYKLVRFRNHPSRNIILGDSRMYSLDSNDILAVSGQRFFNLSIEGASFGEIADAFWFAADRVELKRVYIGLNFLLFNESNRKDRTTGAKFIVRNPLLYFCNYTVIKAAVEIAEISGKGMPALGRPDMSKEEFWRFVLFEETVPGYLNRYVYPVSFVAELERMAAYCRQRGIDLRFVIPPTHVDLQNRVAEMGFSSQEARFKAELGRIAPTYDFEYANDLTREKDNFKDPMHYNAEVGRRLIGEIWGANIVYGRLTRPGAPALGIPAP